MTEKEKALKHFDEVTAIYRDEVGDFDPTGELRAILETSRIGRIDRWSAKLQAGIAFNAVVERAEI